MPWRNVECCDINKLVARLDKCPLNCPCQPITARLAVCGSYYCYTRAVCLKVPRTLPRVEKCGTWTLGYANNCISKLENCPRSRIEVPPTASLTVTLTLTLILTLTLAFDLDFQYHDSYGHTRTHEKGQGQGSLCSNVRVKADGQQMDRRRRLHYLPCYRGR